MVASGGLKRCQVVFGGQSLTYDSNGNLTSDGSDTFSWNARNQLVSITGPNLTATFGYDAFGNRSARLSQWFNEILPVLARIMV